MSEKKGLTVSQVVLGVKDILEGQFRSVEVVGEVSNLSRSSAGHYYFTLSDSQASLSCSFFKMDALRNPFIKKIKNGDKVIILGPLGVYVRRGTFQLVGKRISPLGKGDLKEELELLKKRLAAEGLFDLELKKNIPHLPKRIGLITAHESAAYYDFINVTKRRGLWMDILFEPATVQGQRGAESLRRALSRLIQFHLQCPSPLKLDVIVLTRGGGSLEDLWCFNDEGLAWDIFNCPIPVISAVGHDINFSISDFVADKRCETPSAAAEVLTEGQAQLMTRLFHGKRSLLQRGDFISFEMRKKMSSLSPERMFRTLEGKLGRLSRRLDSCRMDHRLLELTGYHQYFLRLEDLTRRLKKFTLTQENLKLKLQRQYDMLRLLDPHQILGRGYTYIERDSQGSSGKIMGSMKEFDSLKEGDLLNIHFKDGMGKVRKVKKGGE